MRNLTEKQTKFLEVLFEEALGDFVLAKKLAGYSENVSTTSIINSLKEEIATATKDYLVIHGAKAAASMVSVLTDPTQLGSKEKMAAAKDLLDRAGHKATDKIEVKTETPLFILPEKTTDA